MGISLRASVSIITGFFIFFDAMMLSAATPGGQRIDMSVSPIRDEFTIERGESASRTVQFSNNSDVPYPIYVTAEDCVPGGNYGTPICRKASGSGINSELSSTWITFDDTDFVVPPRTSKIITYTITPPMNAAPGGHYGAIFFNNPESTTPNANTVWMIRRIGTLYMMQIPGEIVVDTSVGAVLVDGPGGGVNQLPERWTFDSAPELIGWLLRKWTATPMWGDIITELNPIWEKPSLVDIPFNVSLQVPIKNNGNIHIKPTGKIYLYDENGNQLKKVGKESIVDENGVYIGEIIVDYLPINNERWSVLPNTERTYLVEWLGFWYEERDPITGQLAIQFESPWKYYTRITEEGMQFIYPWERLSIKKVQKDVLAKIEISYFDVSKNTDISETMEVPLRIEYIYIAKTLNYGMLVLILFIIFFAWIFIRKRDKKIEVLEDANEYLEDEITVLERARDTHKAKNTKITPVTTTKKSAKTKTTAKTSPTEEKKKSPTKKPVAKKSAPKKTPPKDNTTI